MTTAKWENIDQKVGRTQLNRNINPETYRGLLPFTLTHTFTSLPQKNPNMMWLFRQTICLKGGHGTGKTENLALTFSDREKTGNFVVLTSIYCIRAVSWTVTWCMKPYHCYGKLHVLVIKILTIVQLSRIERGKGGWQDVFLNSTDQIQSTTNHFCKKKCC